MAHPEPRIVWEMDSREPVLVPGHTPEPHPIVRASKRILRHWYSQTSQVKQCLNYANVSGIAKMFPRSTAAGKILEFWKKEYGYEHRTK